MKRLRSILNRGTESFQNHLDLVKVRGGGYKSALLLSLILNLPVLAGAQSAHEIIENYFGTVSNGDMENWTRIKSAYIESSVQYSSADFHGTLNFAPNAPTVHKLYRVWPNKSRRDLYNDSTLVSSFFAVGKNHFFVLGNMAPVKTSPGVYEPYFEFEPIIIRNLLSRAVSTDLVGLVDQEGIQCYEIRVRSKELLWYLYFNTDSFLLEFWNNSTDGDKSILTRVYDYRKHGDLLIPMSEVKTRNGHVFFSSEISKVELNIDIDPDMFVYKTK